MNILIISPPNPYKTSGVVAYTIYKGLQEKNNNVKIITKYYAKFDSDNIVSMETSTDVLIKYWKNKYKRTLVRLGLDKKIKLNHDYHVQDFDQTHGYYRTKSILKKVNFKPDIIIYLFQQNFLTARNLYELNRITGAPVYWYLMDSAPLTGLCHYSWDCLGYTKGCGYCPALYSNNVNDQSSINFKYKINYLSKTDINIISASEWQYRKAIESQLFKTKPNFKVLLSIDPNEYDFISKKDGKKKLNLPDYKKVIFFGGTSISDIRKGMKYLISALEILKSTYNGLIDNILLLVAGNYDSANFSLPFDYMNLGLLQGSEQLASAYQAADIFLCPSIEDSGPMMINQSIMTGTPVVSFEMGVSLDLVITGKTGYRAKLMDSNDLAQGINFILELSDEARVQMSTNCRELALKSYHPEVTTQQLIEIFKGENVNSLHTGKNTKIIKF
jgi:glycosyltransferase involved in cell wall biosynthesis